MENELFHEDRIFKNIILTENELCNKEFERCVFEHCSFSGFLFTSNLFSKCTFLNCDLSLAKFRKCKMDSVLFKESKVLGADFSECIDFLFSIKMEDCIADYALFTNRKMEKTTFRNTSLKNTVFSGADISESKFIHCDLEGAIFEHTNCKGTDFVSAINYIIDPAQNYIKHAKFSIYGTMGLLTKYDIIIEN